MRRRRGCETRSRPWSGRRAGSRWRTPCRRTCCARPASCSASSRSRCSAAPASSAAASPCCASWAPSRQAARALSNIPRALVKMPFLMTAQKYVPMHLTGSAHSCIVSCTCFSLAWCAAAGAACLCCQTHHQAAQDRHWGHHGQRERGHAGLVHQAQRRGCRGGLHHHCYG